MKIEKLKLPENRKPNVIDKYTVWQAIGVGDQIAPVRGATSPTEDEKKKTEKIIKAQRNYITCTANLYVLYERKAGFCFLRHKN